MGVTHHVGWVARVHGWIHLVVLVGAAYIVDAPDMTLWWSDMEMDEGGGGARGGGMPGALFIDDVIILWLDTAVSCSNMDSEGPKPG